jgi:hypothetical protein
LLQVLAPETGLKLLTWAHEANVILPENQAESRKVEGRLEALQANSRFRIFLHVGVAKGRPVPEVEAIKKALANDGYAVLGVDDKADTYGPGVDYFNDSDKQAAESIAGILTGLLPGNPGAIPVRKQSVQNRNGTIGIWF